MTLDAAELRDLEARTWTDGQGRELTWKTMSVAHLRNTAAYLRRRAHERSAAIEGFGRMLHSDAANAAADDLMAGAEIAGEDDSVLAGEMEAYADHRERA